MSAVADLIEAATTALLEPFVSPSSWHDHVPLSLASNPEGLLIKAVLKAAAARMRFSRRVIGTKAFSRRTGAEHFHVREFVNTPGFPSFASRH